MDAQPYGFYIGAAYAVTALVVLGLIVWAAWDWRRQTRRLAAFEARGTRRRSEVSRAPGPALDAGTAGEGAP